MIHRVSHIISARFEFQTGVHKAERRGVFIKSLEQL